MKYAVFQTGGKQYKVKKDDVLDVELTKDTNKKIKFTEVLLQVDSDKVKIGTPTIKEAVVTATVQDTVKADKIRIARFRAKSRYRKTKGHRQNYTRVKIDSV